MFKIAIQSGAAGGLLYWPLAAMSHPGHGMEGGHWHATDVWGFVALGVALLAAIWFTRSGK